MSAVESVQAGFSYPALEKKWRIGRKKINELVNKGFLQGIDFGVAVGSSRTRFTAEAVAECERRLAIKQPPAPRRRKSADDGISPSVRALLDGDE